MACHVAVGHGNEALRRALGAARIAIDLDEAVGKIDRRIVLHPIDVELQPVLRIAGLVIANQVANGLGLRRLGYFGRLLQIGIRFGEIFGVQTGRNAMIRRARAVNLFLQMPVYFHQARVQRIVLGEILEIGKFDAGVEVVGAGLQDIQAAARALGGDQRLKIGIEERWPQFLDFLLRRRRP